MLVFFTRPTGAGIVATDLLLIPHEGGVTLFGGGLFIGQLAFCGGMGVSCLLYTSDAADETLVV